MGMPELDLITLNLVDKESTSKYELTVENGCWFANEHNHVLKRKHLARQVVETMLLRLKKEDIVALPDQLQATMLVLDLTSFPVNQYMATLTLPIEGYIGNVKEATKYTVIIVDSDCKLHIF